MANKLTRMLKSSTKELRVRRFQFSIHLFCEMFITGNEMNVRVKQGWPEDAVIVGISADDGTYSFSVLVKSEEFEPVKLNKLIPFGEIHLEKWQPEETGETSEASRDKRP